MHEPQRTSLNPTTFKKRFLLKSGKHCYSIPTESIAYVVLEDRYPVIVTLDHHRYCTNYSLDELQGMLNPFYFFRINRHTLVSYACIAHITPWFNGRFRIDPVLECEHDLLVSRGRVASFKEWLDT